MDFKVWDSVRVKPADFLPSPSCQVVLLSANIKDWIAFGTRVLWYLMFAHVTWILDVICAIFIKGISRCYLKIEILERYIRAILLGFSKGFFNKRWLNVSEYSNIICHYSIYECLMFFFCANLVLMIPTRLLLLFRHFRKETNFQCAFYL